MKRLAMWVVLCVAAVTHTAHAQTWSPEERELISHLRACWEAIQKKDFDHWIQVCRPTPEYSVWRPGQAAPMTLEASRKANENVWRTIKSEGAWFNQRPVLIQISGDTAVVYFYASQGGVEDGKIVTSEQMRVETFRKISGKWHVLGGMRVDVKRE